MKRKSRMAYGVAVAMLATFSLIACDKENVSAPDAVNPGDANSSAIETLFPESSSSEVARLPESSSNVALSSSELKSAVSSSSAIALSSSSVALSSSSSLALSSSGKKEWCRHVIGVVCDRSPCHPCDSTKESMSYDCSTGEELMCKGGVWLTPAKFCPDGRWTTYCDGNLLHDPVCCKSEACLNISGKVCAPCMDGYKCPCNPCEEENATAVDCITKEKLVCKDGEWSFRDSEYLRCQSSSIVGTACENGATKVIDGCAYACSDGVYIFAPPPM